MSVVPVCTAHDADGVDVWFLNKKDRCNEYRNITRARDSDEVTGSGPGSEISVESLFRSRRSNGDATMTGTRLHEILDPYVRRCEWIEAANERRMEQGLLDLSVNTPLPRLELPKPINIIMITDGRADDDPASVLRGIAERLDDIRAPPFQVGVQFFQVGGDEIAASALRELDEELSSAGGLQSARDGNRKRVRDMVDTVTFDYVADGQNGARVRVLTRDGILKTVLGAVNRRHDNSKLATRT